MQTPEQQQQMDAAKDQAFRDAQANAEQTQADKPEQQQEPVHGDEAVHDTPAEETRDAKGDFEKVWESLRPEAERLGKLAEWEKEFSQVCGVFAMFTTGLNAPDQSRARHTWRQGGSPLTTLWR